MTHVFKTNVCGYEFAAHPIMSNGGVVSYEVRRRWADTGDDVGLLKVRDGVVITPDGLVCADVQSALEAHAAACVVRECRMSGGWLLRELDAAFRSVRNPSDWKGPIKSTVAKEALAVTAAAVHWFTGTELRIVGESEGEGMVVVEAEGYRAGPAGDH